MKSIEPKVYLIGTPSVVPNEIAAYLAEIGASNAWLDRVTSEEATDGEQLVEFSARLCYRSFEAGLNQNVTKVREDSAEYLANILNQRHGSVLEHAYYVFILHGVSRVLTHEWVRHRVGISISQESMRYVRLDELPFWVPEWARNDPELMTEIARKLDADERFMAFLNEHLGVNDSAAGFAHKKAMTSFVRRFCPMGVGTSMVWGANLRALRHVIELRADAAAEEEARLVGRLVYEAVRRHAPNLFADYVVTPDAFTVSTGKRKV